MHAFDRQTDGRTTDTFLIASPCWHSMQHGKNWKYVKYTVYTLTTPYWTIFIFRFSD